MRADLENGLMADEALQVVLTEKDKERYKIKNRRTVARFVRKYIESKKLPYVVKSFHRDDMGASFLCSTVSTVPVDGLVLELWPQHEISLAATV
jgi:hypothetical protein